MSPLRFSWLFKLEACQFWVAWFPRKLSAAWTHFVRINNQLLNLWSCFVIPRDSIRGEHSTEFSAVVFVRSSPYSNPISHRKLYLDLAQQFHLIQSSLAETFLTAQDFISPLIELHLRPVFQYQVVDSPKEKIDSLKDCRSHEVTLKTKRTVRDKISSRSCISELRISL